MSHEEELLKAESFDRYYFDKPIRFWYNGIEVYGLRFRTFSEFFSLIYNDVIAATTDRYVFNNIKQIGFHNSVRNDPRLIGLQAWEATLRRLNNRRLSLQDIIEWLEDIQLLKPRVQVLEQSHVSLRW